MLLSIQQQFLCVIFNTAVSPKFCQNTNFNDLCVRLEIPGLQEREGKDAAVS